MVRLKVKLLDEEGVFIAFQFHNGSIKRKIIFTLLIYIFSFNSTMVRLKDDSITIVHLGAVVSIPQWFD